MLSQSAVLLILPTLNFRLHTLCAEEFRLAQLFVGFLMLLKLLILIFFDDFDAGKLKRFTDQYLKNRLHLEVEVEKVGILAIIHNGCLLVARGVRHIDCLRSHINEVVWLHIALVNHVLVIAQVVVIVLRVRHLFSSHRLHFTAVGPLAIALERLRKLALALQKKMSLNF
jgi:hypothetical protein